MVSYARSKKNRPIPAPAQDCHDPSAVSNGQVWKSSLCAYKDKRLLKFATEEDLDAAIDFLWSDALEALPHDTPDSRSIIVPAEAVDYFSKAGLKFTAEKLRSISDLGPDEIARLRDNSHSSRGS
jgi:hypothetical protein